MTEAKKDNVETAEESVAAETGTVTEAESTEETANAETANAETAEAVQQDPKDAHIEELQQKLDEEENQRLRMMADFENYKRRVALDKEALQKYKAQDILTNLIPVLDNFERALSVETESEEAKSIMTGVEMVHRSFLQALETEGVTEIDALNKEFDPNFHQAIMTGNDEEKDAGTVLEVFQKGYLLKDRVIRPAMVKVNE